MSEALRSSARYRDWPDQGFYFVPRELDVGREMEIHEHLHRRHDESIPESWSVTSMWMTKLTACCDMACSVLAAIGSFLSGLRVTRRSGFLGDGAEA